MADTKISALTAITGTALTAGDLFVVVDTGDTTMAASGTDKKITASDLALYVERTIRDSVAITRLNVNY